MSRQINIEWQTQLIWCYLNLHWPTDVCEERSSVHIAHSADTLNLTVCVCFSGDELEMFQSVENNVIHSILFDMVICLVYIVQRSASVILLFPVKSRTIFALLIMNWSLCSIPPIYSVNTNRDLSLSLSLQLTHTLTLADRQPLSLS